MDQIVRAKRAILIAAAVVLAAGCSTRPASGPGAVAANGNAIPSRTVDIRRLEGNFTWISVNDSKPPVTFPAGSSVTLISGTLDLRNTAGASSGSAGRFGLRFSMRMKQGDPEQLTGDDGSFRITMDSLLFTPDKRDTRPPVTFTWRWEADTLVLTDSEGNVWDYVRTRR